MSDPMSPRYGQIWRCQFEPPDKRRPAVVITRPEALPLLRTTMVAPIVSTIRGISSEVVVGPDEGLKHVSAVSLDNVQTVDQRQLRGYVGQLSPAKMDEVCRALAIATGCNQTP